MEVGKNTMDSHTCVATTSIKTWGCAVTPKLFSCEHDCKATRIIFLFLVNTPKHFS